MFEQCHSRRLSVWRLFCCVPFSAILALFAATEVMAWQAGVGKVDITPTEPMWMAGYGARTHHSTGTCIPLWGKVLVLEDSTGQRVVAITLDLVGIDAVTSRTLCDRISARHHFPRSHIAIFCSHTHCGPVAGLKLMPMYDLSEEDRQRVTIYTESLLDKVTGAVDAALTDLAPSELAWSQGRVGFAVNRRQNREADVPDLRASGLLQGPVDHDVPILQINSGDQIKAILFGYACHATTLDFYEWCGDYPGFAMQQLEAEYPGAQAMFWAGCGADQNPIPRRKLELAEQYGSLLGTEVQTALLSNVTPVNGALRVEYQTVDIPFATTPTLDEIDAAIESKDHYEVLRAKFLKHQIETQGVLAKTYAYPIQTWQLGDGPVWVILGGEVVVDYSLRLKSEFRSMSEDRPLWVASYANDVMAYIPSRSVLQAGGYEGGGAMVYFGHPSPWAESIEETIIQIVHQQWSNLQRAGSGGQ